MQDTKPTVWGLFDNAKETRKVDAGTVIFREGDQGSEMFGIVDGEVEVRGGEALAQRLGPREIFGEMALVDDSPRSATAVAAADTTLAIIDRHRFLFLVQETPTFALDVMAVMADRLRQRA
jgi:CRP/FNR family cyclic AMP-dependent transcriptional regulator